MSRRDHTVWVSGIDERELLRLDRANGAIIVPVCSLSVAQLRELMTAAEECYAIATLPKAVIGQKGGAL
jgi:hypothetical protein